MLLFSLTAFLDCCGDSSAMSEMFHRHFLQSEREDRDDLLFYVKTDAREVSSILCGVDAPLYEL